MKGRSGSMLAAMAFVAFTCVAACSSGSTPEGSSGTTPGSSSGGSGSSGVGSSGSSGVGSSGSSGTSGTSGTPATVGIPASCPGGDEGGAVPTTPVEIQAWLGTGKYKCWAHESKQHKSGGPHGGEVLTYLNAALDTSLAGTAEHPQGAVAVKEFFPVGSSTVNGWAVGVKTQASSANGQGWYWYEAFGVNAGASTIEGQGKALCVNCHAVGSKDYILIPHPLR